MTRLAMTASAVLSAAGVAADGVQHVAQAAVSSNAPWSGIVTGAGQIGLAGVLLLGVKMLRSGELQFRQQSDREFALASLITGAGDREERYLRAFEGEKERAQESAELQVETNRLLGEAMFVLGHSPAKSRAAAKRVTKRSGDVSRARRAR